MDKRGSLKSLLEFARDSLHEIGSVWPKEWKGVRGYKKAISHIERVLTDVRDAVMLPETKSLSKVKVGYRVSAVVGLLEAAAALLYDEKEYRALIQIIHDALNKRLNKDWKRSNFEKDYHQSG